MTTRDYFRHYCCSYRCLGNLALDPRNNNFFVFFASFFQPEYAVRFIHVQSSNPCWSDPGYLHFFLISSFPSIVDRDTCSPIFIVKLRILNASAFYGVYLRFYNAFPALCQFFFPHLLSKSWCHPYISYLIVYSVK